MRRVLICLAVCALAGMWAPAADAGGGRPDPPRTLSERIADLQDEVDSLTEDIEDLRKPVAEFDLFDQCAFTIGVTQFGSWDGHDGVLFGPRGAQRRPLLAMDMRGFGRPQYRFLAFPAEEPPSIECNEDAGEELIDN
jgi:hypothetical protein